MGLLDTNLGQTGAAANIGNSPEEGML